MDACPKAISRAPTSHSRPLTSLHHARTLYTSTSACRAPLRLSLGVTFTRKPSPIRNRPQARKELQVDLYRLPHCAPTVFTSVTKSQSKANKIMDPRPQGQMFLLHLCTSSTGPSTWDTACNTSAGRMSRHNAASRLYRGRFFYQLPKGHRQRLCSDSACWGGGLLYLGLPGFSLVTVP